jgi:hypothetical protein
VSSQRAKSLARASEGGKAPVFDLKSTRYLMMCLEGGGGVGNMYFVAHYYYFYVYLLRAIVIWF